MKREKEKVKKPAYNERFGATAAGRADLKGSAGKPPLRQAAIPLAAMRRQRGRESTASKREYNPTTQCGKPTDKKK